MRLQKEDKEGDCLIIRRISNLSTFSIIPTQIDENGPPFLMIRLVTDYVIEV